MGSVRRGNCGLRIVSVNFLIRRPPPGTFPLRPKLRGNGFLDATGGLSHLCNTVHENSTHSLQFHLDCCKAGFWVISLRMGKFSNFHKFSETRLASLNGFLLPVEDIRLC
ncbi:hypothetical protein F0562_031682 [Nyssa sinensis]|uniref:Uncharacterized protein n=1 Tax=Nyssa sinensis TaxID=561372 RepID=A0A5J5ASQ0_9ASTE|nr:hypothetical protein F0562_031682 [Nyssa sinensis]